MCGKDAEDLAHEFYIRTHGNLFFMSQLLEALQDTGLLSFDYGTLQWAWILEDIKRQASVSENVLEIVFSRLEQLPEHVCGTLKLASCFGNRFSRESIELCRSIFGIGEDSVVPNLQLLCQHELLIQLDEQNYKFSHDTIQLAAYSLLPDADGIDKLNWDIGRTLLKLADLERRDWLFFACVDQLNLGQALAQTEEERIRIAELNLEAGARAAAMSAFLPSSEYLKNGIQVLGSNPFDQSAYCDLAIQLHSLYAKCEYCIGHIDESRLIADLVVVNARSDAQKESPYLTLIACFLLTIRPTNWWTLS